MACTKDLARSVAGNSKVTEGRNKVDVKEIIEKYPNGITLVAFDLFNGNDGQYAVYNFGEDPEAFFMSGKLLTNYALTLVAAFGSLEEANAALDKEPVKVLLRRTKTKKGKDCTVFDVLD